MNYTASSVKKVLDANKILSIEGGLLCPQDQNWTLDGNTECCRNTQLCPHIGKQTCKQRINISEKNGVKLTILTFYFTISQTNLDGVIDEEDKPLQRLMRNEKYSINPGMFVRI